MGKIQIHNAKKIINMKKKYTTRRQFLGRAAGSMAGVALGVRNSAAHAASYELDPGTMATDGTVAMTDIASYPDPFINTGYRDAIRIPTCSMMVGPCHDDLAPEREDISEGQSGMPMRFGFKILDDQYRPVSDANIDVWHCNVSGIYSSETADTPDFCTGDNPPALASRFLRGHRMTDENGSVWFNSCMPGWYRPRAVHVHVTIRRSNRQGQEYLTTQFAYPSEFLRKLFDDHPDYSPYGQPPTSNEADFVFDTNTIDDYTFNLERMSDGALMAWMIIMVRSSLSDELCEIEPGIPPRGMGPGGI